MFAQSCPLPYCSELFVTPLLQASFSPFRQKCQNVSKSVKSVDNVPRSEPPSTVFNGDSDAGGRLGATVSRVSESGAV